MRPAAPAAPAGYVALEVRGVHVVALAALAPMVCDALRDGSLHQYAARHPAHRILQGRAAVYAAPLPDESTRVVVRHAWHGGLLRRVTGDRFLVPTRAPHELDVALALAAGGVPVPEIVAYALYPAGPRLQRADVASREVTGARDLALVLVDRPDEATRRAALDATATLLARLADVGARHADLNLKNVLLAPAGDGAFTAWVLDVDRVTFTTPADPAVLVRNLARLARSADKWRRVRGARIDGGDIAWLGARARERARARAA